VKEFKHEVWEKKEKGDYKKVENQKKEKYYGQGDLGADVFVTSGGSCRGDSGGPYYTREDDHYILLGIVSGGRGHFKDCGGINNPTHNTRVKMFGGWIRSMLGRRDSSQLCWNNSFNKIFHKSSH